MKKIFILTIVLILIISSIPTFASFQVNPNQTVLKWPTVSTTVTDTFGEPRNHGYHRGIDIGAVSPGVWGDNVFSAGYGKVMFAGVKIYGRLIAINHDLRGNNL
ncbi:MAG: hypothetical protein SCL54_01850 [Bacillota bacterium]|nr:hypothetical protein [Bacillota bacterium]